jgi:D-alanyl-lipoteichoic acid acyltransferase DltB (MBOAT superfamily)
MLFQSPIFFLFFLIVFALYWSMSRSRIAQNVLILVSSYIFYGWWDWRLLGLIFLVSLSDFLIGAALGRVEDTRQRKLCVWTSVGINLSILGFFKYYNFFANEMSRLLDSLGIECGNLYLGVILPVGVSFYIFQTMSYTLDVYSRKLAPTHDFVAFFPQLVAGPIERASHLLPQFASNRHFDYRKAVEGSRLILWGFFKKLIVADSCAAFVDPVFSNYGAESGWVLAIALAFFAFQIYGDFSGYSDIARGLAMLLGFDLMVNFNLPYFSKSPSEFWRRWHISLSTWFRDYVYIPLGGSRVSLWRQCANIILVFTISGLWHGANWTFLMWGFLNGMLVLPSVFVRGLPKEGKGKTIFPKVIKNCISILGTFIAICITWLFFRSNTMQDACQYLWVMIADCVEHPGGCVVAARRMIFREPATSAIIMLLAIELALSKWSNLPDLIPKPFRWLIYLAAVTVVIWIAFYRDATEFIYFQF